MTTSVLKMQRELVAVTEERDRLAAEVRRLREENERLRKDAERYQWFRAASQEDVLRLSHYAFYALDAAIDAARGAE